LLFFLNFLRGSSWAVLLFGGLFYLYYFFPRVGLFYCVLCLIPGAVLVVLTSLLSENYQLKHDKKEK